MAQEHNEPHSKAPLQPQLNPYAPPLSSLASPTPPDKINRPLESQILDLLNSLANDPIQVCAQLDEFLFDGAVRAEPQGNRVGRGFRAAMIITGIASFSFLLLRDFRLLAISVAIAASIGLLTAARFSRAPIPKRRSQPIHLPQGEYTWLISDGGLMITTPGGSQWAIPWHNVERIHCDAYAWEILTYHDQTPPWRMPLIAFAKSDADRFQLVVNSIQALASARRPHPVLFADQVEWSDQLQLLTGQNWSALCESPRVWCDIGGLVCSLPNTEVTYEGNAMIVKDCETKWTVELPAPLSASGL